MDQELKEVRALAASANRRALFLERKINELTNEVLVLKRIVGLAKPTESSYLDEEEG